MKTLTNKITTSQEYLQALEACRSRQEVIELVERTDPLSDTPAGYSPNYHLIDPSLHALYRLDTEVLDVISSTPVKAEYYGLRIIGTEIVVKQNGGAFKGHHKKVFWSNGFFSNTGLNRSWKNKILVSGIVKRPDPEK